MPRYEFFCEGCMWKHEIDLTLKEFNRIDSGKEDIPCPECGWKKMERVISVPTLSSKRVTKGY